MDSLISIIIPHFNRVALLKETLLSVTSQSYTHWEIIVVDDQSDKEAWEQLQQLANDKIKIVQRASGVKGPSSCRNLGAEMAKGEYLIFLDSDDLLAPHCLQQRIDAMSKNVSADFGIFLMQEFSETPNENGAIFNQIIPEEEWINAFIRNENPWAVTSPIWRKTSFLKIGGFDDQFLFMEDPELHLRALYSGLKGKQFYDLPPDCFYRMHHMDATKSAFYRHSVLYRIQFYEKLTSAAFDQRWTGKYALDIKKGIEVLIRVFLYSRKSEFEDLYRRLIAWMRSSGLYSRSEIGRYQFLLNLGNSSNWVLRKLRVKGLCYRLLPKYG